MASNLKKIKFPYNDMVIKELYFDENYKKALNGADTKGIRTVFSREFYFGDVYEDRPYVFNSLVLSIDGKIAFEDQPQGPLIAKKNELAGNGGMVDYWILNVLRGSADAILTGTVSINAEVSTGGTGHCYDEEIENYRELQGNNPVPLGIVVTLDGNDINYNAAIFNSNEKATVFYTTKVGYINLVNSSKKEVVLVNEDYIINKEDIDANKVYAIVNGETMFNHREGLKLLKRMGIDRLLVESPTVSHYFMKEKLLDELFLNYSCLYVGGKATAMGNGCPSFTSVDHPHTKLISIHMFNPHFLYFRHKLVYDNGDK